ncbi:MAG TPA: hypothetical protein VJ455_10815 [Ignavibacteria bacterium]|nr:hypothetical protein [Ignavibacteria bacterium]
MNKTTFVVMVALFISFAAGLNSQERIKFGKGESSATVEGGVERGGSHYYLVKAARDQWMVVTIMSVEDNAVFQIINKKTGNYLPGAEDGTDIKRWEGYLPSTGDYKIIVGSTRGGTEYTLKVTIE